MAVIGDLISAGVFGQSGPKKKKTNWSEEVESQNKYNRYQGSLWTRTET